MFSFKLLRVLSNVSAEGRPAVRGRHCRRRLVIYDEGTEQEHGSSDGVEIDVGQYIFGRIYVCFLAMFFQN